MFTRLTVGIYAGLILVLLASCSQKPETDKSEVESLPAVIQSKSDKRSYKPLILDNGLQVLLVSDPDTSKAAVSLNVDVGSGADPAGREGLAHFVEHMLFLGTGKYPEADAYQSFISERGGQHNAYTAFEDTNYFFDVSADALYPAMDRFSQFFIAPLFTQQYLERERLAVHSEYKAKVENELRRYLDVLKSQLNPKHPFAKFTVGNKSTLRTDGLADSVLAFYKTHYFAKNMQLAVYGKEPLAELETWVSELFSPIKAGDVLQDKVITEPLFLEGVLPRLLELKPLKDRRSVSISFPLPDLEQHKLDKPVQLLGHLLGHEGEGSLFLYLKQKGWVESLSAGNFLSYPGGSLFSINISLTPKGIDNVDLIVESVFSAIALIKEVGLEAWRFQELSDVNQLQFDYQPQSEALDHASQLASVMSEYPIENWLNGNYLMQSFNRDLLESLLAHMVVNNAFISIAKPDANTNKQSPWYQSEYREREIDAQSLYRWKKPGKIVDLALPLVNPFVPDDLTVGVKDADKPSLLKQAKGVSIWYQPVAKFNEPRAYVKFKLSQANVEQNVETAVVYQIAAKLLDDDVNRAVYDAKTMGYSANVSSVHYGLGITAYGYDQKLDALLNVAVSKIKNVDWSQALFLRAKAELLRAWKNQYLAPPYKQLSSAQYADYVSPVWRAEQLAESIQSLSFERFITLWQRQSNFNYVTGLIVGNVDNDAANLLAEQALRFAPAKLKAAEKMPISEAKNIDVGETQTVLKVASQDAGVMVYLQSAEKGMRGRALSALTAKVYESGFFHQLRTEQQLGYIVYMANRLLSKKPGLMMVVQSPSHSETEVLEAVDRYLAGMLAEDNVNESDFILHKQSLVKALLKPSTNIAEFGGKVWRNILHEEFNFDEMEQLVEVLEALSFDEWRAFVKTLVSEETQRRVNYITGNKL